MALRNVLKGRKHSPAWQYRAKGILWRVGPVEPASLAGEDRDPGRKEVRFFCLDRRTGDVRWEGKRFGDTWWTGIEGGAENVLLLHGYAHPDLPGHRGLIAVDTLTGDFLWSNEECAYAGAAGGVVFGSRFSTTGSELVDIDVRTGAILQVRSESHGVGGGMGSPGGPVDEQSPTLPLPIAAMGDEGSVKAVIQGTGLDTGTCEVATHGEIVVAAGVRPRGAKGEKEHVLVVIDRRSGAALFDDVLMKRVRFMAPESFFILRGMLYFIRFRSTLVAVPLGQH